jgi:hypothetical protein
MWVADVADARQLRFEGASCNFATTGLPPIVLAAKMRRATMEAARTSGIQAAVSTREVRHGNLIGFRFSSVG